MKHFLLLLVLLAFQNDTATDYNLLVGCWKQKAFANTADTGIFIFNRDSTATLEMRKAGSDELIGSMGGRYSIDRKQNRLSMNMMGRAKIFSIIKLESDVLTIKNISENKDPQTFERCDVKK